MRVTLSGEDGADDGLSAHAINVAEDVMQLEIHLCEHLLHEVKLRGGMLHQLAAVAHEIAQRHNLQSRTEGFAQQSGCVQLL